MESTVGELIKELKKYPKHMKVYCQAHDNSMLETQGGVTAVFLIDFDEERKNNRDQSCDDMGNTGEAVILRG